MNPIFLERSSGINSAFKIVRNARPYIHQSWHYHEEMELVYMEHGCGTRIIGDSIQPYQQGDLVLLGSNLPHQWKSDSEDMSSLDYSTESLAIYFLRDFPGVDFFDLPEMEKIKNLIQQSTRGVKVQDSRVKSDIHQKLKYLLHSKGVQKILMLFSILELIANAKNNELLASESFIESFNYYQDRRINKIYHYINSHFKREISLSELASVINMTPNSLCRYFKKITGKTPIGYLNEIRINHACKLLSKRDQTIAQCAFESGFKNLANFNRRFKFVLGMSPKEYIQKSKEQGTSERLYGF